MGIPSYQQQQSHNKFIFLLCTTWNNVSNIIHQLKVGLSRMPGENKGLLMKRSLVHKILNSSIQSWEAKIANNMIDTIYTVLQLHTNLYCITIDC